MPRVHLHVSRDADSSIWHYIFVFGARFLRASFAPRTRPSFDQLFCFSSRACATLWDMNLEQDIQVRIHHFKIRKRDADLVLARGASDQVQVQSQPQFYRLYATPLPPTSPHFELSDPISTSVVASSRPPTNVYFVRGQTLLGLQLKYSSANVAQPPSTRIQSLVASNTGFSFENSARGWVSR